MQIKLWPQNEKRLMEKTKLTMRTPTMEANIGLDLYLTKLKKTKKNGSRRP